MKKIRSRIGLCSVVLALFFAAILLLLNTYRRNASKWFLTAYNRHLYSSENVLLTGTVADRNGTVLSYVSNGVRLYHAGDTLRYEGMLNSLKQFLLRNLPFKTSRIVRFFCCVFSLFSPDFLINHSLIKNVIPVPVSAKIVIKTGSHGERSKSTYASWLSEFFFLISSRTNNKYLRNVHV